MIKLQNYTPEVYYKESRDFQFIGRLFDLVLNYSKTNADLINNLYSTEKSDDAYIQLLVTTLGFKAKHKYTTTQLRAICAAFSEILKAKGTIKAVLIACRAILNAENINGEISYSLTNNNTNLNLFVPDKLGSTILINDLLEYILPAGMSCSIIKELRINAPATTSIGTNTSIFKVFDAGDRTNETIKSIIYDSNVTAILPILTKTGVTNRKTGLLATTDAIKAMPVYNRQSDNKEDIIPGLTTISTVYKVGGEE